MSKYFQIPGASVTGCVNFITQSYPCAEPGRAESALLPLETSSVPPSAARLQIATAERIQRIFPDMFRVAEPRECPNGW